MPDLNIVICPGCGSRLPLDNRGCPDCGYENNDDGRLLTIAEILERPSYPDAGAMRLNDVSPAFVKAVIAAAQADSDDEQYEVVGVSGRRLYGPGTKSECDSWVAAGNVGGSYSVDRIVI